MYKSDENTLFLQRNGEVEGRAPNPAKNKRSFVTHIINGLHTGGAEMMLYKLLSAMDREQYDAQVITLIDGGDIKRKVESLGIEVYSLGIPIKGFSAGGIGQLIRHLRQKSPDIIQTWMYHADLAGGVIGKLFTKAPIVWNIQTSDFVHHTENTRTVWTVKLCALLSFIVPSRIISCSKVSCEIHARLGYQEGKFVPIPNAVELSDFRPNALARKSLREELNLAPDTPLVGMVARFHPQKDHHNFVQAAARLHQTMPDVHFVLCGDDVAWDNQTLSQWIRDANLANYVHLLGRRQDTPRINAALDVATLSSAYGEGFPNVLVEAMACGVPCVTTDSGDAALIVAGTGISVPIRNPEALAHGWETLLKLPAEEKEKLSRAVRQHVEENYALPSVVARYESLYKELLGMA